jgi:hypothetical protein
MWNKFSIIINGTIILNLDLFYLSCFKCATVALIIESLLPW